MANDISSLEYVEWLAGLKTRIRESQTRAVVAVNSELILLYWQIGHDIWERQTKQGWGTKVVKQVAADLQREFPDMKGFSPRSLNAMLAFAKAWPDQAILPQLVAKLPWGHNRVLLDKLDLHSDREWYARAAIEHGWSRNVLVQQIDNRVRDRQGAAITNFRKTLPSHQSELAQQIAKDPISSIFSLLTRTPKKETSKMG